MDLGLNGRVAAVAAASKGLGKAVARQLAAEGARVAICSRDSERIHTAAAELHQETGVEIWPIVADVSTLSGCQRFIAETAEHFGQLDILVTNAGGPPSGPALDMTDEQWQLAINLNLLSTVRMVYAALPHLQRSEQGRVIAITSISAKQPLENMVLSNTTRAGVLGFIKTLANELGHTGVTFNAVLPGWTRTARVDELLTNFARLRQTSLEEVTAGITASIPAGRMGTVTEFAAVVAFIASGQGGYLNGVALTIDGGSSKSVF